MTDTPPRPPLPDWRCSALTRPFANVPELLFTRLLLLCLNKIQLFPLSVRIVFAFACRSPPPHLMGSDGRADSLDRSRRRRGEDGSAVMWAYYSGGVGGVVIPSIPVASVPAPPPPPPPLSFPASLPSSHPPPSIPVCQVDMESQKEAAAIRRAPPGLVRCHVHSRLGWSITRATSKMNLSVHIVTPSTCIVNTTLQKWS